VNEGVTSAIERCERPSLVFDLRVVEANMRRVAAAARAAEIIPLFAMKSFPHAGVRALAAEILDGFDVASLGELGEATTDKILSVADPTGAAIAGARATRVIVACETVDQVRAAPAGAEIAIRISASITGRDPAVGAVLDGTGYRRSRFGLDDPAQIAELAQAARGRRVGVHVHHGPVTATSAKRFVASAQAALALVKDASFVDLGGAWHGVTDLDGAFREVRSALGSIEILVEPGRLYAEGAGFACGRVLAWRPLADRLLVVCELSRVCHLKWSQVELVTRAPRPGAGHKVLITGPTCYEEDAIGEWTVEDLGGRVVVENVSGYALAWNTSFGGVPAADVVVLT
jgi:diaminopimelate decarboxylase